MVRVEIVALVLLGCASGQAANPPKARYPAGQKPTAESQAPSSAPSRPTSEPNRANEPDAEIIIPLKDGASVTEPAVASESASQKTICLVVMVKKQQPDCDKSLPDDLFPFWPRWCSLLTVVRPAYLAGRELFFWGAGKLPSDSPFGRVGVELEARMKQRYIDGRGTLGTNAIEFGPCH